MNKGRQLKPSKSIVFMTLTTFVKIIGFVFIKVY